MNGTFTTSPATGTETQMAYPAGRHKQQTVALALGEHQHADVVESDCLYPLSAEGDPGITSDVCAAVGFGSGPSDIITAQSKDEVLQKVVRQLPAGRPRLQGEWRAKPVLKRFW